MGQARPGAPPPSVAALPQAPGVYRFRDTRAGVLYVGRAASLRRRVASYWGDLGSRGHLAPMVARIVRVQSLVCDSEHEAAWLERNLLERQLPRWNRTAGGQEEPVYIRLDLRPRLAGLKVVHAASPVGAARYFGPYIGGSGSGSRPPPCTGCCPSHTPRMACAARTVIWRGPSGSAPATVRR
jgi:excinuclease ABC subunit C